MVRRARMDRRPGNCRVRQRSDTLAKEAQMPRTFSATELAVGIGVSALVGLGVGYAVGKSAHNKQLDADITLTETAAGRCEPSYPRTISGYHGDHVTWSISNNCKSGYF